MNVAKSTICSRRTVLTAGAGLAVLGVTARSGIRSRSPMVSAKEGFKLYSYADSGLLTLIPLDLETLADNTAEPSISVGAGLPGTVIASSAARIIAKSTDTSTVVIDPETGLERQLDLHLESWPMAINPSGDRLVAQRWDESDGQGTQSWLAINTSNGDVISTIGPFGGWNLSIVDDAVTRLHRLTTPDFDGAWPDGPLPVALVVHDLFKGTELGRVEIPELLAGNWKTGKTWGEGSGEEVMAFQTPGLAFSPDRARFAIVHPDGGTITIVHSANLHVERQISVHEKRSALDRLASYLQIVPQEASAKAAEGTDRSALFASDGASLYVWGNVASVDETIHWNGIGLQRIDLETGEILATALKNRQIDRVMPLGDLLLVSSFANSDPANSVSESPFTLSRLDQLTLSVKAERTYSAWCGFVPVRW